MAESHDIPGYLREPWEKGAPEIPKEVRMKAPERFQWDRTWLDQVRRDCSNPVSNPDHPVVPVPAQTQSQDTVPPGNDT